MKPLSWLPAHILAEILKTEFIVAQHMPENHETRKQKKKNKERASVKKNKK